MDQRENHVAAGLALLATQYRRKPHLAAILSSYLNQVQELEDVFFGILAILIDSDNQVGEQLDLLGCWAGQPREGRTDAVYLQWIHARRLVNRSSGLPDEILKVLALVAPEVTRELRFFYPASFLVDLHGAMTSDAEAVAAIVRATRGAGINGQLVYSLKDDSETFLWSTGDTEEASTAQGWADDSPVTTGGYFAGVEAA